MFVMFPSLWLHHGWTRALCSCFVPPAAKQPTMKGRQWRHFCVEWPHIVAGLFGPLSWPDGPAAARPPSPELAAAVRLPHPGLGDESDGDVSEDQEDASGPFHGASNRGPIIHDPLYRELCRTILWEDAVLHVFCQAAKLNGLIWGDNAADAVVTTRKEAIYMAELAEMV